VQSLNKLKKLEKLKTKTKQLRIAKGEKYIQIHTTLYSEKEKYETRNRKIKEWHEVKQREKLHLASN